MEKGWTKIFKHSALDAYINSAPTALSNSTEEDRLGALYILGRTILFYDHEYYKLLPTIADARKAAILALQPAPEDTWFSLGVTYRAVAEYLCGVDKIGFILERLGVKKPFTAAHLPFLYMAVCCFNGGSGSKVWRFSPPKALWNNCEQIGPESAALKIGKLIQDNAQQWNASGGDVMLSPDDAVAVASISNESEALVGDDQLLFARIRAAEAAQQSDSAQVHPSDLKKRLADAKKAMRCTTPKPFGVVHRRKIEQF
jgi:hypothetical protein